MPESEKALSSFVRTNQILAALPEEEMRRVTPELEHVKLTSRMSLFEEHRPIEYVYFVHHGVASMVAIMKEAAPVEIATVGPEGMVGMAPFFGSDRVPYRALVQVVGEGTRMKVDAFERIIKACPTLSRILSLYALALMNQIAQNGACNRAHSVDERCARWLLLTHDRVQAASFELTQEFLAQMLGVRRPSVSIAAGMLAQAGLITYSRGKMTVRDRTGLEAASCECYRVIKDEFERLLGNGNFTEAQAIRSTS
jgi:CRP-like cAMP-binding protein